MDTKVLFRALMWSFVAFFAWQIIAFRIWGPPPRREQQATTQPADTATADADEMDEPTPTPTTGESGKAKPQLTARSAETAESFTLGTVEQAEQSPYRMAVELSNVGASLRRATLSDFAEHARKPERYRLLHEIESADGGLAGSMVLEQITLDDGLEVDLSKTVWSGQVERTESAEKVKFTTDVVDDSGQAVLGLAVTYTLPVQPADARRYDLDMSLSVTNRDDKPHRVIARIRGPVGLQRNDIRADDRAVTVAKKSEGVLGQVSKAFRQQAGKPSWEFADDGGKSPYWWAAAGNKFFTCAMTPLSSDGRESPGYLASIQSVDLDEQAETADDVTFKVVTRPETLASGASVTYPFACYLGPLDREGFASQTNPDYQRRQYLLLITRSYSFCTFGWLTELMIVLMNGMVHIPPHNYGVAIIVLVLVVRLGLHPLTKKGQVNMMKMQKQMGKLAPKMEEIKKKYANDRARMNQEVQKLYQTEGVNPAGQMLTCLPMFLQMPIWVALWTSLNNNIGMRHEPFCLWIRDLTAPDALIELGSSFHVPLLGNMIGPITSLNILPILWAISMYAQQKLMPKPPKPAGQSSAQSDQAAQMQKMMPLMSVMFALILYNAPSGLTLYIMASTVFGTLEQVRIRQHIRELEEQGGGAGADAKKPKGPRGPLWLQRIKGQVASQWRHAQQQADQAHKLRSRK
ncbi:MAG: YidC/Oxa1 family insertase periplasmic-domain containing protein [Phycisphaerae bacterium]